MQFALQLPWRHNGDLIEKIKNRTTRLWYMQETVKNGWSRNVLNMQIKTVAHERTGTAITNFSQTLPSVKSDLAQQILKDPYMFDFLTLDEPFRERDVELALVKTYRKIPA